MLEILKLIKLMAIYTVFCTMGLFLSIFLASSILVLLREGSLELAVIISLSAKKSLFAGLISAFSMVVFLYVHRFFIDDKAG